MLPLLGRAVRTLFLALAAALGVIPRPDFLLDEKYHRLRRFYGDRVLDFGAGTCAFARFLQDRGHAVTPLDVVDASLDPEIRPLVHRGLPLPFPDGAFDTVLAFFVLHHLENQDEVLAELERVSARFVILGEDLSETVLDRWLTGLHTSSSPWARARESFRSESSWDDVLARHGLRTVHKVRVPRLAIPYYPVRRLVTVLEKGSGESAGR